MQIVKQVKNEALVHRIDAVSRVAVWAANHSNSPLISKLGLTHISNGVTDSSGRKILHVIWPGLTLERYDAIMPQGQFPHQYEMIPTTVSSPQQMGYDSASLAIPQFFPASPCNIPQIISEMTGGYDPVYVATKLGLFQRDMDKVSGPKLCRYLCPPLLRYDELYDMLCYDADGNFQARYELSGGLLFEVKHFKFCDSPEYGKLYFAPRESSVYVPLNCNGIFSTTPRIAIGNPNTGSIITAGGVEKLDWKIIRRFGENTRLIWPVFLDDPLLSKNNFAEAFSIVTEAKHHGIEMKILKATAREMTFGDSWEAEEELLPDQTVKMQARQYGIKIDPVWKNGLPGEIVFDDEPLVREVPPFWTGNRVAVFFGKRSAAFMKEFVIWRFAPWIDCGRVLVVVDEKDRELARQIHVAGGSKVRAFSFDVFKDKNVLSQVDMIFIVPPRDDSEMKVVTPAILDVCAQAELPVGIFSRSEDAPQQEIAADTVLYCVSKSQSDEGSVFAVKNMETNIITNYKFSPAGVTEKPETGNDMKEQA